MEGSPVSVLQTLKLERWRGNLCQFSRRKTDPLHHDLQDLKHNSKLYKLQINKKLYKSTKKQSWESISSRWTPELLRVALYATENKTAAFCAEKWEKIQIISFNFTPAFEMERFLHYP